MTVVTQVAVTLAAPQLGVSRNFVATEPPTILTTGEDVRRSIAA